MFHLLGNMTKMAFFGVLTIVLIGPALAVLGVLAPFAVMGLPAFGLYYYLTRERRRRELALRKAAALDCPPAKPVSAPVVAAREAPAPARRVPVVAAQPPRPQPRSRERSSVRMFFEAFCGSVVGGIIGLAISNNFGRSPKEMLFVIAGTVAGAVLGLVVGAPGKESKKPAVAAG
jgi:hypothetical protein